MDAFNKRRERLTLSLDSDLMRELDSLSFNRSVSRSKAIRDMLREALQAKRPKVWTRADVLSLKDDAAARYYAEQKLKAAAEESLALPSPKTPSLATSALIIPRRKIETGTLVQSVSFLWEELANNLCHDWNAAYQMPPEKMEEFVAGAFQKDGFDEVILTPRSGDFGRDIIASKRGIGCVKILGSVKRYAPGRFVRQDDVRALIGVVCADQSSSKGMLITTSDFPKRILDDPFIGPLVPNRVELVNGAALRDWIDRLRRAR